MSRKHKSRLRLVLVAFVAPILACIAANVAVAGDVDFARDVRPILADKCLKCHGVDQASRQADLRLDIEAGIRQAFGKGDLNASEAWQRIQSADADLRMPPPDSGKELKPHEVDVLRRWMEAGAPWAGHWAFSRIDRPPLPAVNRQDWPRNDVDRFVLARLEREGLAPSSEATREALIRRLSFDLIGLPPTLAEIDAFVRDDAPDAYDRLVDRLLSSPHYGERMAIDWLDAARYADTNGYQNDFERSMWPWRDWVIQAFNAHVPFDRFAVEQLAGDLLPGATQSQRVATGFNRNHRTVTEAGSIDEEWRVENVIDRVETTGTVFLGLTVGCARCHDHKYDPISQREFYQLYSFFNNVNEVGVYTEKRGNAAPIERLPSDEQRKQLAELDQKLAVARKENEALQRDAPRIVAAWLSAQSKVDDDGTAGKPSLALPLADSCDGADGNGQPVSTTSAAPPKFLPGPLGNAASFDGTQSIDAGQAVRFERDRPWSWCAWVRPSEGGAMFSKIDDAQKHRGVDAVVKPDGKLEIHLVHAWPSIAIKVVAKKTLPRDVWTHVAASYDGSSRAAGLSIFISGEATDSKTEKDSLAASIETDQPLRIGKRSASLPFHGRLRDLRFYNRVLGKDEVAGAMSAALAPQVAADAQADPRANDDELVRLGENLPDSELQASKRTLETLESDRKQLAEAIPTVMTMEELPQPREAFVLTRGRYDMPDKKQPVSAAVPEFLPRLPADAPANRLTLARWVVSSENPLTARVVVNRLWSQFFGRGLVATTENFGVQAEPPSHPELLDWLADELIRTNWNILAMQKLIATSAAYRQTSATTPAIIARDPDNRLLARGPRVRLSAEMVRDNALAVAGLLSMKIGGPSVKPYQPEGIWAELGGAQERGYEQDHGENLYRRGLYTFRRRTIPHPGMSTFDAPSWEVCQVKRLNTNTPLQALALLNDTTYVEAARKLAERMLTEAGATFDERIEFAFRLATGRRPAAEELAALRAGFERYAKVYRDHPDAAREMLRHGEAPVDDKLNPVELAPFAAVASVILNLDETITKE